MILKYFQNDSVIIIKYKDGEWTLLDLICSSPNKITKELLTVLTKNNNIIRYRHEWQKLLQGIDAVNFNLNNRNYLRPFWRSIKNVSSDSAERAEAIDFVNILMRAFKDDSSMLYYLLGSNKHIALRIYHLIMGPEDSYHDTHEIMQVLLNETNIDYKVKYQWFSNIISSIFQEYCFHLYGRYKFGSKFMCNYEIF